MDQTPQRTQEILDNLYDGIYFTDRERRITYWNRGAERISGFRADQVVGSRCADNILVHVDSQGNNLCIGECPLLICIRTGQPQEAQVYLHHVDGHRVPVNVRAQPLRDEHGEVQGAAEIFSDNSSILTAMQRINELEGAATQDQVTGVGNCAYAVIRMETILNDFKQRKNPTGLLLIDIDAFARWNETQMGYALGDRVLRMVANTINHNIGIYDVACRVGGDEFLVILSHSEAVQTAAAAEKLRVLIEHSLLAEGDEIVRVTVSIGATDFRPGDSIEALTDRVERLMAQSKSNGRNRITAG